MHAYCLVKFKFIFHFIKTDIQTQYFSLRTIQRCFYCICRYKLNISNYIVITNYISRHSFMTYTNSVHRNLSHYRICHCPQNTASGARSAPATRALSNEKPVLPYVWLKLEFDWSEAAFFAVSVARRRCKPHHEEQRISDQIGSMSMNCMPFCFRN